MATIILQKRLNPSYQYLEAILLLIIDVWPLKSLDHPIKTSSADLSIYPAGSKEIYYQHYGQYGIDTIWRDDVLPCRTYLRHW